MSTQLKLPLCTHFPAMGRLLHVAACPVPVYPRQKAPSVYACISAHQGLPSITFPAYWPQCMTALLASVEGPHQ